MYVIWIYTYIYIYIEIRHMECMYVYTQIYTRIYVYITCKGSHEEFKTGWVHGWTSLRLEGGVDPTSNDTWSPCCSS